MFTKKITTLVDIMLENKMIKSEDKDIIIYGLSAAIEIIFNIITTIVLGFIFSLVLESIMFLLAFSFLRTYAGGYHCERATSCYFMSSGVIVVVLLIIKFIPIEYTLPINLVLIFIAVLIILKLSPMGSTYKPLDEAEKNRYRKKSIIYLTIELIVICILFLLKLHSFASVICLAIIVSSSLLVLQWFCINKHI